MHAITISQKDFNYRVKLQKRRVSFSSSSLQKKHPGFSFIRILVKKSFVGKILCRRLK